jgi:hypothetical protein
MTFLVIPATGLSYIAFQKPLPGLISDILGGAMPISYRAPGDYLFIQRETSAEDSPRNDVAGVLISALRQQFVPMAGPVVVTGAEEVYGTGSYSADLTPLPHGVAMNMWESCEDIRAALANRPGDVMHAPDPQLWSSFVRELARILREKPMNSRPAAVVDPVAELFELLGLHVHPQPFGAN